MPIKTATAKVINLDTAFDAAPVETPSGPMIWATVTIEYRVSGLNPTVSIRVPINWDEHETATERNSSALQSARHLIDHACQAAGVPAVEPHLIADLIEEIIPVSLEGVTQELGLATPTPTSGAAK